MLKTECTRLWTISETCAGKKPYRGRALRDSRIYLFPTRGHLERTSTCESSTRAAAREVALLRRAQQLGRIDLGLFEYIHHAPFQRAHLQRRATLDSLLRPHSLCAHLERVCVFFCVFFLLQKSAYTTCVEKEPNNDPKTRKCASRSMPWSSRTDLACPLSLTCRCVRFCCFLTKPRSCTRFGEDLN